MNQPKTDGIQNNSNPKNGGVLNFSFLRLFIVHFSKGFEQYQLCFSHKKLLFTVETF